MSTIRITIASIESRHATDHEVIWEGDNEQEAEEFYLANLKRLPKEKWQHYFALTERVAPLPLLDEHSSLCGRA